MIDTLACPSTHTRSTCTGVLLTNLGTPEAPTTKAVRRYLREFLSDRRVVELPRWLWLPLLYTVILPFRSGYSAKLYQRIWTEQGSPLLYHARLQQKGLQNLLNKQSPERNVKVALGMRYGKPTIAGALAELRSAGAEKIIVLPLYPQYAAATVGSTFDAVTRELRYWRTVPKLHMINHYADNTFYIKALANHIQLYWQTTKPGEKLLFSFHGLPQRSIAAGDPYFSLCHQTARLVAAELALPAERWQVVFQSRFGRAKWLQPYCDETLKSLAVGGVRELDVVCPGFSADCLETLEEMAIRNHEVFLSSGGKQLNYIPALNDNPEHLAALASMINSLL